MSFDNVYFASGPGRTRPLREPRADSKPAGDGRATAGFREEIAAADLRCAELVSVLDRTAALRHVGESDDGMARAVVDGTGALLEIDIPRWAFDTAFPHRVGPAVIAAVARAKVTAAAADTAALETVLSSHRAEGNDHARRF
jgi:hypothetical protein